MRFKAMNLVFFWLSLTFGARLSAQQVLALPDLTTIRLESIDAVELGRFLNSAMIFQADGGRTLYAFEMITRCSLKVSMDPSTKTVGDSELISLGHDYVNASAPSIAAHTAIELTAMLDGLPKADTDRCRNRILGYFGFQYDVDGRELETLILRASDVLKGGSIEHGLNAIADETARNATAIARARIAPLLKSPLFLGAVRRKEQVSVILGDAGGVVRWVMQFRLTGPEAYELEGGVDAGIPSDLS